MAERVVDRCEEALGRRPTVSRTALEPLPGGDFPDTIEKLRSRIEALGLDALQAERAAMLYGSEAPELFSGGGGVAVEAECAVRSEGALTLEDYWVRRSARAHFDGDGGMAALDAAADRMAELLEWSPEERNRQLEACRDLRDRELRGVETVAPAMNGIGGKEP
jgi:glycerol-3-phosphate dehydrogenase